MRDLIKTKEMKTFRECNIGMDFYRDILKANLNDFSSLQEWSADDTYSNGDRVLWFDSALESTADANTSDPSDEGATWEVVPKFNDTYPSLNVLWEDYLRKYLSFAVVATSLTYGTYKAGANGLVKYSEDYRENSTGLITVERAERFDYKKELIDDANDTLIGMFEFVKEAYETGEFPEFGSIQYVKDNCGDDCPPINKKAYGTRLNFLT